MDSGHDQIAAHFGQVETRHYEDSIVTDEVDSLLDFILSTKPMSPLADDRLIAFIG